MEELNRMKQPVSVETGMALRQPGKLKGSLLVCFSAAAFGLMPVFAKYAYGDGASPLAFLALRFWIAAFFLTLVAVIKGENLRLTPKQYLALVGLGVGGYSAVACFYFFAITKIPASVTSLILYTYPIIVTLYAIFSGEERIEYRKVVALAVSFFGIVLILDSSLRGLNVTGLLLASGSAIFYSLYIIFSNKLLRRITPLVTTTCISWSAAVALSIAALATGSLKIDFGYIGWASIFAIALISTVGGILAFQMGLGIVGPSQSSIISTFEPLVTVLLSFLLFDEMLTPKQVLGGGFVLFATVLLQLPRKGYRDGKKGVITKC